MRQPKYRRKNVRYSSSVFFATLILDPGRGCAGLRGEVDGFIDSERRKEDIILGAVLNVATVVAFDL